MIKTKYIISLTALCLICCVVAPPVDPKKNKHDQEKQQEDEDLGLEYGRYLQQVVQILEEDKDFAKKLENVSADDIKSGNVAKELEFVQHHVRTKLDELKRMELDRLRNLVRQEMEQNELGLDRDQVKSSHHVDLRNPHTFEVEDLRKLIKTASKDLDELNVQRKEEFKQYELDKEHQYREGLKHMNEQERKAAEAKHQESLERHKEHPKIHHPGSKQQLEQVWEEQDQLPREEFNPSTFFAMHDINGDGHLDEEEVEAILSLEIKKMYDNNNTDDDPVEMMEEYHRMREHIYNETDSNRDGLISKQEFLDMTRRADFAQDDGWKGLEDQNVFSEDDLVAYEEHLRRLAAQGQFDPNLQYHGGNGPQYINPGPPYHHEGVPNEQFHQGQGIPPQGHPNQYPPQGHPNQYPPQGHPNQYPPQGGQHPNQYPPQGGQHPNQYPPQGGQHPNQYPQGGQQNQYPPQGQQGQPNQYPAQGGQQNQYPQGGQHASQYPPQGGQYQPQKVTQQGTPPQQNVPQSQGVPQQQGNLNVPVQQQTNVNVPVQQGSNNVPQPNQAQESHPPVPHQASSVPPAVQSSQKA